MSDWNDPASAPTNDFQAWVKAYERLAQLGEVGKVYWTKMQAEWAASIPGVMEALRRVAQSYGFADVEVVIIDEAGREEPTKDVFEREEG